MSYNTQRDNINLYDHHLIDEVLPSHIVSSHDQFVKFLKYYYEYTHTDDLYYQIVYQEDTNKIDDIIFLTIDEYNRRITEIKSRKYDIEIDFDKDWWKDEYEFLTSTQIEIIRQKELDAFKVVMESPTKLLHEIINTRDINQVDIDLLSNIQYELLLGDDYLEGFKNKRIAPKLSNYLYRSKGTLFSIKQFFKMFFNTWVDVSYPKKDVFLVGSAYDKDREMKQYRLYNNHTFTISNAYNDLINGTPTKWTYFLLSTIEGAPSTGFNTYYRGDIIGQEIFSAEQNLERFNTFLDNLYNSDREFILKNIYYSTVNIETPLGYIAPFDYRPKLYIDENASKIGYESQKFITDNKLYQVYSILIKSSIPFSEWEESYKAFVHPAGLYIGNELHISSIVNNEPNSFIDDPEIPPLNINSTVTLDLNPVTDITGLIPNSNNETIRILLPGSVDYYNNYYGLDTYEVTLDQLNNTYDTLEEFALVTSKTFDEGTPGSGTVWPNTSAYFSQDAQGLSTLDEDFYPYVDPLTQLYIDGNGTYVLDENGNKVYLP